MNRRLLDHSRKELLQAAKEGAGPVDYAARLHRYSVNQHARTYRSLREIDARLRVEAAAARSVA